MLQLNFYVQGLTLLTYGLNSIDNIKIKWVLTQ